MYGKTPKENKAVTKMTRKMTPTGEWLPHSNDSSGDVLSYASGGLNMLVYHIFHS